MKITHLMRTSLAFLAVASVVLAPSAALAQGKSKGKSNNHSWNSKQGKWNPAPPKKNGRHDNRDWNKNRNDDRDDRWDNRNNDRDDRTDGRWVNGRWMPYSDRDNRYDARDGRWVNGRWVTNNASIDRLSDRRQQTKNEWRNIAYISGAAAILGLINKDKTLVFAGTAGALYSLYRYEQDRKSQSRVDRLRATYFSQPYFTRDGDRYNRRLVTRNGQRYYQFVRG